MKTRVVIVALVVVSLACYALINAASAGTAQPVIAQAIQPQTTFEPTNSPTPEPTATTNPAVIATGTAAAAYLLEIQAEQAALDLQIAQAAATMTAFPPMATMTAIAANDAQATANAENTRVSGIVATATEQRLMILAGTPTAIALQQAQVRGSIVSGLLVVFGGLLMLIVGWLARLVLERVNIDNAMRRAQLVNMQAGIEQPYTPTVTEFAEAGENHWVRKPNIRASSERRIAAYVVNNKTWRDDMRNGDGVGLTYDVFTAYRDYLVAIGVLRESGNGYAVANIEYFRERAAMPSPTD